MVHGIDFTTPWGSIRKANKKGMPLLTTGMCKAIQEQNLTEEAFRAKLNAVTTRISEWVNSGDDAGMNKVTMNAEVEFIKDCGAQAIDLQNDTAGYFAQCAQMDNVFSSYYWLWRAGVTKKTFPALSMYLFRLGQKSRGRKKVLKDLEQTAMRQGKNLIAIAPTDEFENRVYLHPGVFTISRLSDMGACFGALPVGNPDLVDSCSGHPKFLLNLKLWNCW